MPTTVALPHQHLHTVEDYYLMAETGILKPEDRVELIDGVIVDMVSIGSKHAGVVNRLNQCLVAAVANRAIVSIQNAVRLNDLSEPEPDVALLKYRQDFYAEAHPTPDDLLLIIEVANSSLNYDRDVKLPLYARHNIPQVWLIDLNADELWIYSQPQDGTYQKKIKANLQQPVALPEISGVEIDLSALF
ncbi:MAG: Uma2 family endonuclease [Candidatus Polarisedimenticolaceae bacterium]|nr:Uma2 family endonuclease [Candidatus Polarisedimenticolaceae bacterium]